MATRDIYQEITDKIITLLEQVNLEAYEAPFAALAAQGLPFNPVTDHRYQGINIPSLWFDQQEKGFALNHWATFKQWKERGAQVRKGEKASPIIFFKALCREEANERGETEKISIPMMRFYSVFNADQVEGYEHAETIAANAEDQITPIERAERFCANTKTDIRHGGSGAYYHRNLDFINMPDKRAFIETRHASATENYYATLLHELTHWSGAPHRLDRDKANDSTKERDKYAFEELIAELGSAFLCAQLGVTQSPREDHALYIKSWLKALRDDKKYVFKASAQAAKAAEYLNGLQGGAS